MNIHSNVLKFSSAGNTNAPSRLGIRYSETEFLPEGGNTVVCHLDVAEPAHEAILQARDRMQQLPGADGFLFTPISSLHMTLYNGALETQRAPNYWPNWLSLDAEMSDVTASLFNRLSVFKALPDFSVRVDDISPTGLKLSGASDKDEHIMREWRDAFCDPFGYRHPDHDEYSFHMTFAYPVRWIADENVSTWEQAYQSILGDLQSAAPIIPLRAPAFCTFDDMTHFEEILHFVR